MKKSLLVLCALALPAVCLTTGCQVAVRPPVVAVGPPPLVVGGPTAVVVQDYWFDGSCYYYFEPSLGLYFWVDGGVRHYMDHGWLPSSGWHRHDAGWRHDGGWHGRGHRSGHR